MCCGMIHKNVSLKKGHENDVLSSATIFKILFEFSNLVVQEEFFFLGGGSLQDRKTKKTTIFAWSEFEDHQNQKFPTREDSLLPGSDSLPQNRILI